MNRTLLGLSFFTLAAASAFAQAPNGKVGVINIQNAIVSTADGQKAASELDAKAAPRRKEFEGKQNELNGLKDQLQKGQNTMSEAAKADLIRKIDDQTKRLNRDMEDASAEFDQAQQKILQGLGQKMLAIIDKYAKDNSFALILDVSSPQTPVLFASNSIDITRDIIDLYNKNAGSLTPAKPASSSAAPAAPGATAKPKP